MSTDADMSDLAALRNAICKVADFALEAGLLSARDARRLAAIALVDLHISAASESALEALEKASIALNGGHVTLFRFTSGWKAMWATPWMSEDQRIHLWSQPPNMTLEQAITHLLQPCEE